MKNLKILFLIAFSFVIAHSAFALDCKNGNYAASDECWTTVTVDPLATTPVVKGTVLEYSFASGSAEQAGYLVSPSNASSDWTHIAGVAQKPIATGDTANVLVRGHGFIQAKQSSNFTSGDALWVSTTHDVGSVISATGARPIGFALQSQSGGAGTASTIDAYITVV